jgi:CubicO group peptidase (beta-lactamase class C family)
MTKAITSFGVLKLWEKGLIDLDDPIKKYIPEFEYVEILDSFDESDSSYTTRKRTKDITIRQLLTHTSGIGYDFIDGNPAIKAIYHKKKQDFMDYGVLCFCDQDVTIGESIRILSSVPLHHEPGEKYTYGIGLDVLGYLIEIVSNKSLDVFFKEEIFDPLEMNDTYFYIPESKSERLVPVQTFNSGLSYNTNITENDSWVIFTDDRFNVNYPIEGERVFFAGGCGLSSTVKDYYNFLSIFINEGKFKGKQIIKKTTNDMIFENQLDVDLNKSMGLVFGVTSKIDSWFNKNRDEGVLYTGGYWNTNAFADDDKKIIAIIYKQTQFTNENSWGKFREIIYQSID